MTGPATSGTAPGLVVLVVVLVVALGAVLVVVVLSSTGVVSPGSSGGAGFCHTDWVAGAPTLGNRLSRIAYVAPADPITATKVAIATNHGPEPRNLRSPLFGPGAEPPASPGPEGAREKTGERCDGFPPCPWSSQLSLTISTLTPRHR